MAERSAGGGRRASLTMYDPLRDIYTTVPDDQDAAERVARHAAQVGVSDSEPKIMPDKEALSHTTDSPTIKAPHSIIHPNEPDSQTVPNKPSRHFLPSPPSKDRSSNPRSRNSPHIDNASAEHHIRPSSLSKGQGAHRREAMAASSGSPHPADQTPIEAQDNGNLANVQRQDGRPNDMKRKLTEDEAASDKPGQAPSQPLSKRKRQEERHLKARKRGRTPPSAYSRRDRSPPIRSNQGRDSRSRSPRRSPDGRYRDSGPRRSRSPFPRERSRTPEAQARQRKRPGGGARLGNAGRDALRRRQEERERLQQEEVEQTLRDRGVSDVVRQHYNAVPERGREWRKTDSKIKGLRSFNNWIKSTLIQKFSPDEDFVSRVTGAKEWAADGALPPVEEKRLLVVDLGCGKGGDLGKWQLAPQPVDLYVGLDPAEISIEQARDRYQGMRSGRGPRGRSGHQLFHAEFHPKDCFGEWLGDLRIIQDVGIDANVGPGGNLMSSRWGGGGFDVVVSMFTMHYAFESEEKARQMLRNVAGVLKKGGRFLGVGPNSDAISARVVDFHRRRKEREEATKAGEIEAPEDGEVEEETPEWGNSIYRVRFPGATPEDGIFRPPFNWKYSYFMEEAVEEIPEYVVPWEAFRALAEEYNLELQYRKPFLDVWKEEKDDPELGPLSERMGVRGRGAGPLLVSEEELEAASFYHAFCFYKA